MAFCTSCGKQVEDDSRFCVHCGARLEEPVAAGSVPPEPPPQASAPQQSPEPQQAPPQQLPYGQSGGGAGAPYQQQPTVPPKPRRKMPLWLIILIIAVAAVIAAAAATVLILNRLNDPQKTISAFTDSVMAQDYEAFSKITCAASEDLELTEESVAPFFALYSGRTGILEDCQDSLSEDLARLRQGEEAIGNGLVRLVEHNHMIFKTYEVEISGKQFAFRTNLDNCQITVGGQTITAEKADQDYKLLLLPGRYDITASCTNEILGETFSTDLKDCELTQSNGSWYLNIEHSAVYLEETDLPLSSLTVNGRDYGPVEFNSSGEFPILPLPEDVEIEAVYDVDGVTLRDSCTLSGGFTREYFYPEPALDEDTARVILEQAGQEIRDWFDVYNSGDLTALQALDYGGTSPVITHYIDEMAGGQDSSNLYHTVYMYVIDGITGDLEWSRERGGDLTYSTLISLDMDYYYASYYEGALTDQGGPSPEDITIRVYMQRSNGGWTLSRLDWASYYDVSDMSQPYAMEGSSKPATVQDYLIRNKVMLDAVIESAKSESQGMMELSITARGNSLVYSYTYAIDIGDPAAAKAALDESLESQAYIFENAYSDLKNEIPSAASIVIEYYDMYGSLITSREYT